MSTIIKCPHCRATVDLFGVAPGGSIVCQRCKNPVTVPNQSPPPQPVANNSNGPLAKFLNEEQDATSVARAYERVQQIVTSGEEIIYIAVQKRPVVNVSPDCIVLTTRRFIVYRLSMLGRSSFDDYIWRDLSDVRLKEGMLGATLSMRTSGGLNLSIDYLPKLQARKLYRFAQEMEERAAEERRARELESQRAAAGGVVLHGSHPGSPVPASPAEDPVKKLQQLKSMLDGGLISADEYASKKAQILSQM